jgi:hypothetical protein
VTKAAASAAEIACAPVLATRKFMGGTHSSRKPVRSQVGVATSLSTGEGLLAGRFVQTACST